MLLDENGAAGHSDIGFGYMVAADNWSPTPGAIRVWRFDMDVRGGQPVGAYRHLMPHPRQLQAHEFLERGLVIGEEDFQSVKRLGVFHES